MSQRTINQIQAINEALHFAMEKDPNVVCLGLGVDDPKRIFGTTAGLVEKYGSERVFDTPTSENAMTGIIIGASLNGLRPVMTHQRFDFFLLAMDQIVNGAAKWRYMFGGQNSVPITIRLVVGHGWGQGPTHSQNLHAWFAHVPGLKVVLPTTPADAKGLLLSSIFDDNPVLFIEHRWLHHVEGHVPKEDFYIPIGKANLLHEGDDLTIVSLSYMTIEALHAVDYLHKFNIYPELIDLRSVQPIDWETIKRSVKKTGRLLVLDTSSMTCSVASEIIAKTTIDCFSYLKAAPFRITQPDFPSPTSFALTKGFYPRAEEIAQAAAKLINREIDITPLTESRKVPHDVPGDWFKGPF